MSGCDVVKHMWSEVFPFVTYVRELISTLWLHALLQDDDSCLQNADFTQVNIGKWWVIRVSPVGTGKCVTFYFCADTTNITGLSIDSSQVLYNQGTCSVSVSLPSPLSALCCLSI